MFRRTALLVAGLLLIAGCSSGQQAAQNREGQAGFVSGTGNVSVFAPADRKPAPALTGTTLDGKPWSLADQTGKVVVLNVWGSWCPPCRKEAPDLVAAAKELGPTVQFIGLNTRDHDAEARAYEQSFGVTYPSLIDESGELQLAFHESLPFDSIPSTLVIDRDGRVAARILGATSYTQLADIVDQISSES